MTIRFFGELFSPLRMAFDDQGRAQGLLADLGCNVTLTETQYTSLRNIATLSDTLDQLADLADRAAEADATASAAEIAEIAAASIQMIESAWSAVQSLGSLDTADLLALPSPLDQSTTWAELAQALPDYLLVRWLRLQMPPLYAAAVAAGVVVDRSDATGATVRTTTVDLGAIGALVADPAAHLISSYGWGAGLDHRRLLDGVERFTRSLGLRTVRGPIEAQFAAKYYGDALSTGVEQITVTLVTPRPDNGFASSVVHLLAVPPAPDGEAPSGFAIEHRGFGIVETSVSIADDWTLAVSATADADGPGMRLDPSGVHPVGLATPTLLSVTIVGEPVSPWRPVGTASGPRLEISRLAGTFELGSDAGGQTAALELSTEQGGHPSLVATLAGEDGFLASLLGGPFSVEIPLTIRWSTDEGWTIDGALGTQVVIPLSLSIGPIELLELVVGIAASPGGVDATIAVSVAGQLGPMSATVDGLGLSLALAAGADDGASGLRAELGIKPPDAVGLTVALEAITGGGYLAIDHEIGRYSGALAIEVVTIGIQAITVIDTQLPGNPDGFAVFASLTITFPGIPLGFGFVLTGLGGIVAINRTLDAEALATGLRNGVIDSLLFPKDPIGDAAQLIAQIDDYFPLMEGNAVFGPVVEIGWGTPTPLVTAQLGVVISIPDAVIAVLGSISALLPTPAAPLITLHLDVLGVIDIPAGEMSLVASLYDSRLLATIDLSGDMAMYVRATSQPYFLLSVGGYHPAFQPPSNLPAAMHDLRRMTASIEIASNVAVMIQSYFALTSNTVQFGASVNVEAAVEIWPTTYSARGWFEFNVMLQFDPFKILADMSAGVAVYSGNKELLGVQLSVQLEGPEPWYLVGNATFRFFGVKVKFDVEVGSKAAGEPKPTVPLRDQVLAELAAGGSWSEAGPADGLAAGIIFGALDPAATGDIVWVRPDHQLSVTQSVAPVDRDIEVVGQGLPAPGHERLTVTAAGIGTVADTQSETVEDWFAPAQYEAMSSTERLTRASFELMPAGVAFGSADAVVPDASDCTSTTTGYESETWAPDTDPVEASRRLAGVHESMRFTPGRTTPMFTLAATEFTVVNAVDGTIGFPDGVSGVIGPTALARGVSQRTALDATAAALAANPALASSVKVVPVSALVTAAAAQP